MVMHSLVLMNTRIHSPLIDPLIATLAGGAWTNAQRPMLSKLQPPKEF
jgi:hypothetical protein